MTDGEIPTTPVPPESPADAPEAPPEAPAEEAEVPQQGIQAANQASLEEDDPITAGLPDAMKLEGPAQQKTSQFGEMQSPAAPPPMAAPPQQIAPVSANGEQTSARTAPTADVPANAPDTQPGAADNTPADSSPEAGLSPAEAPGDAPADPAALPAEETPPAPDPYAEEFGEPVGEPEAPVDPIQQANKLLQEIPGRMRLY